MALYDAIALLLLVAVTPFVGLFDVRALRRAEREGRSDGRIRFYRRTTLLEWAVTALLLAGWFAVGREADALRIVPDVEGARWWSVAGALLLCGLFVAQSVIVRRDPAKLAAVRPQLGTIALIAPRTPTEGRWFDLVSVTAGICEEVLYRGIVLAILARWTGLWPAVFLSSVAFGVGHAYQGPVGIVRTAIVGLVMAVLVVTSGTLLTAIVLHAVIDLSQGRMIGAAVRVPEPEAAAG